MKLKANLGLVLCLAFTQAYAAEPADFMYTVKQGDTLIVLTAELLDKPTRWNQVAQLNKLPNPNLIYPGKVLHIPFQWLRNEPSAARIEAVSGQVTLNGQPAKIGDAVSSGSKLETAKGAATRMSLPDGSSINVLEQSQLEATQLNKKKQGNFFSALFRLSSGRIDALKRKYPDGQSPLHIQAAHATIGIRGTHFRVGQEGDNTLAEIEYGLVGFAPDKGGKTLALAAGQGSFANGKQAPRVITLLPAPTFKDLPERFEQILVRVNLAEINGAQGFRGEVASDEQFANIIAQANADGTQLRIPNLADGTYWLRVRAIDAQGLQGQEASTRFVLKAHPVAPMLIGPANNGKVRGEVPKFAWNEVSEADKSHLQLAKDRQFHALVSDQAGMSGQSFTPEQALPVGEYFWRVASVKGADDQGPWGDVRVLRVLPPTAPPTPPAFTKGRMASSWDAEPGQTFDYQLASSKNFAKPVVDLKLSEPKVDIAMPEPGKYYVRLRAIDADGYVGPWTPTQSFTTPGHDVEGCGNCQWGTP